MSNIYKVNLSKIKQESLKDVFVLLEYQLSKLGINFYLIGAIAKDMWMSGIYDMELGRITADLDLAVLVENEIQYETLKLNLVATGRFWALKENKYTLRFDNSVQIDLLPFGGLNIGEINLTDVLALTNITNGFAEVHENGTEQIDIEGNHYAVSTLAGIVLLKLIAYDDRPENRGKDLTDIGNIVRYYDHIFGEDIFEEGFSDLLNLDSQLKISSQLLGRHIFPIIEHSLFLLQRVNRILDQYDLFLEERVINQHTNEIINILKEIKTGINSK